MGSQNVQLSSNWKKLQASLTARPTSTPTSSTSLKRKRPEEKVRDACSTKSESPRAAKKRRDSRGQGSHHLKATSNSKAQQPAQLQAVGSAQRQKQKRAAKTHSATTSAAAAAAAAASATPTKKTSKAMTEAAVFKEAEVAEGQGQGQGQGRSGAASTTETVQKVNQTQRPDRSPSQSRGRENEGFNPGVSVGKFLALDCEMVDVSPTPHISRQSALARVSIVNYNGEQVYDSFVAPPVPITDYRTHVSGIVPAHMQVARSFKSVQAEVAELLKGKTVIGHGLRNDFDVLMLDHPRHLVRDTARFPAYRKIAGGVSPRLKVLAEELLGLDIQSGEHSSVEDARACMLLFRRDKDGFEREYGRSWGSKGKAGNGNVKEQEKGKGKGKAGDKTTGPSVDDGSTSVKVLEEGTSTQHETGRVMRKDEAEGEDADEDSNAEDAENVEKDDAVVGNVDTRPKKAKKKKKKKKRKN